MLIRPILFQKLYDGDATPIWQTSATRCDVYLDCRQELSSCGTPSNWSTWWILDGADDADCVRQADAKAKLNSQIVEVQASLRKDIPLLLFTHFLKGKF